MTKKQLDPRLDELVLYGIFSRTRAMILQWTAQENSGSPMLRYKGLVYLLIDHRTTCAACHEDEDECCCEQFTSSPVCMIITPEGAGRSAQFNSDEAPSLIRLADYFKEHRPRYVKPRGYIEVDKYKALEVFEDEVIRVINTRSDA